jgi:hypothetical protein
VIIANSRGLSTTRPGMRGMASLLLSSGLSVGFAGTSELCCATTFIERPF